VRGARSAARDEVRHARIMTRLARREGTAVPRVVHSPLSVRSLEALALENATEACVGETYGAALAAWQAHHARDPEVREAMQRIASDELRHAALGHAIAEWLTPMLTPAARHRVLAATRDALAALASGVALDAPSAEIVHAVGLPEPRDALRLATVVEGLAEGSLRSRADVVR